MNISSFSDYFWKFADYGHFFADQLTLFRVGTIFMDVRYFCD